MKVVVAILVVLLVVVVVMIYRGQEVRHAGFSFSYQNGDCAVWYSRKGRQVIDVLIVPRTRLADCLNAGDSIVHTPDGDVPFGTRGMAYVFDGHEWANRVIAPLHEQDIPHIDSLTSCTNISEVAERILAHPQQK